MWTILYKSDGNVFYQLKQTYCKRNASVRKTKQIRLMLLSNCTVCGKEKSRFNKYQEASRLELH